MNDAAQRRSWTFYEAVKVVIFAFSQDHVK